MSDNVVQTFGSLGGTRRRERGPARTRGGNGRPVNGASSAGSLHGQGDVRLYGIGDHLSAGKTGTAQLGGEQAPPSWFFGFAPAEDGGDAGDRDRRARRGLASPMVLVF